MVLRIVWSGILLLVSAAASAHDGTGSISGDVGFPSEEVPAMRVYALSVDGKTSYSVNTQRKQVRFNIRGLPPGQYFVVAYANEAPGDPSSAGGWTRFVQCGMKVSCADHALVPVTVAAGRNSGGVQVADWFVPAGTLPPEPAPVASGNVRAADCAQRGSQLETDMCNLKGYEAADKSLNVEYRRAMAALEKLPACKERLKQAQLAWIKFRDEHCTYEGATREKGRRSECLRETTEQRVDYLKQQSAEVCHP